MIRFENVTKQYEDGFVALKNMNLEIRRGELVALIGPSGCGKTTTMRMINRLIEPTSGKVYIDGQDISELDPVELRRNIGYVIQQNRLVSAYDDRGKHRARAEVEKMGKTRL